MAMVPTTIEVSGPVAGMDTCAGHASVVSAFDKLSLEGEDLRKNPREMSLSESLQLN